MLRKELKSEELSQISSKIVEKIKSNDAYSKSTNVMSYLAKDMEVSVSNLHNEKSKNWYLPSIKKVGTFEEIVSVPYDAEKNRLNVGRFGILEPEIIGENYFDQVSKKVNLDLILVPGLCFDKRGYRVGFGKGFYDRFLKKNKNTFTIGCCPKDCLVEELPIDDWDVCLDLVITEG